MTSPAAGVQLVGVNPDNGLPYVCWNHLPGGVRNEFKELFQKDGGCVMYFFSLVLKVGRKIVPQTRVLMVSHTAVYQCMTTSHCNRCVKIVDIAEVLITKDDWLGLRVHARGEHDMLFKLPSTDKIDNFRHVINTLYREKTGRDISVQEVPKNKSIKAMLNLKKQANFEVKKEPFVLKVHVWRAYSRRKKREAEAEAAGRVASATPGGISNLAIPETVDLIKSAPPGADSPCDTPRTAATTFDERVASPSPVPMLPSEAGGGPRSNGPLPSVQSIPPPAMPGGTADSVSPPPERDAAPRDPSNSEHTADIPKTPPAVAAAATPSLPRPPIAPSPQRQALPPFAKGDLLLVKRSTGAWDRCSVVSVSPSSYIVETVERFDRKEVFFDEAAIYLRNVPADCEGRELMLGDAVKVVNDPAAGDPAMPDCTGRTGTLIQIPGMEPGAVASVRVVTASGHARVVDLRATDMEYCPTDCEGAAIEPGDDIEMLCDVTSDGATAMRGSKYMVVQTPGDERNMAAVIDVDGALIDVRSRDIRLAYMSPDRVERDEVAVRQESDAAGGERAQVRAPEMGGTTAAAATLAPLPPASPEGVSAHADAHPGSVTPQDMSAALASHVRGDAEEPSPPPPPPPTSTHHAMHPMGAGTSVTAGTEPSVFVSSASSVSATTVHDPAAPGPRPNCGSPPIDDITSGAVHRSHVIPPLPPLSLDSLSAAAGAGGAAANTTVASTASSSVSAGGHSPPGVSIQQHPQPQPQQLPPQARYGGADDTAPPAPAGGGGAGGVGGGISVFGMRPKQQAEGTDPQRPAPKAPHSTRIDPVVGVIDAPPQVDDVTAASLAAAAAASAPAANRRSRMPIVDTAGDEWEEDAVERDIRSALSRTLPMRDEALQGRPEDGGRGTAQPQAHSAGDLRADVSVSGMGSRGRPHPPPHQPPSAGGADAGVLGLMFSQGDFGKLGEFITSLCAEYRNQVALLRDELDRKTADCLTLEQRLQEHAGTRQGTPMSLPAGDPMGYGGVPGDTRGSTRSLLALEGELRASQADLRQELVSAQHSLVAETQREAHNTIQRLLDDKFTDLQAAMGDKDATITAYKQRTAELEAEVRRAQEEARLLRRQVQDRDTENSVLREQAVAVQAVIDAQTQQMRAKDDAHRMLVEELEEQVLALQIANEAKQTDTLLLREAVALAEKRAQAQSPRRDTGAAAHDPAAPHASATTNAGGGGDSVYANLNQRQKRVYDMGADELQTFLGTVLQFCGETCAAFAGMNGAEMMNMPLTDLNRRFKPGEYTILCDALQLIPLATEKQASARRERSMRRSRSPSRLTVVNCDGVATPELLAWILNSRSKMVEDIWRGYEKIKSCKALLTSAGRVLHRGDRFMKDDLGGIIDRSSTSIRAAERGLAAVVTEYFMDFEKLHLGVAGMKRDPPRARSRSRSPRTAGAGAGDSNSRLTSTERRMLARLTSSLFQSHRNQQAKSGLRSHSKPRGGSAAPSAPRQPSLPFPLSYHDSRTPPKTRRGASPENAARASSASSYDDDILRNGVGGGSGGAAGKHASSANDDASSKGFEQVMYLTPPPTASLFSQATAKDVVAGVGGPNGTATESSHHTSPPRSRHTVRAAMRERAHARASRSPGTSRSRAASPNVAFGRSALPRTPSPLTRRRSDLHTVTTRNRTAALRTQSPQSTVSAGQGPAQRLLAMGDGHGHGPKARRGHLGRDFRDQSSSVDSRPESVPLSAWQTDLKPVHIFQTGHT